MESYIQFTDADFAHYDPATAYVVGCIVNTRDFQNAVAALRKKYGERKVDRKKLAAHLESVRFTSPLIQDDTAPGDPPNHLEVELYEFEKSRKLHEDVNKKLRSMGKAKDNLWRALLLAYVKLGILPRLPEVEIRPDSETVARQWRALGYDVTAHDVLEEVRKAYERADELEAEGKAEEAEKLLRYVELSFVHSDRISASSRRGDVVIRISPSASGDDIRHAIAATKEYRQFFRKKGNFGSKNALHPHHLKEMVMLSEGKIGGKDKMESEDIATHMHKKYRISLNGTAVRQLIRRARSMGF